MHRPFRRRRLAPAALVAVLALAGAASAQVVQLPPNGQVNDDPAIGIDPNQDASVSDVVGGALDATKPAGEWQTFDITFVGRKLTVVLNGKTIQDGVTVEGITGGAINPYEDEPGPLMLQGDHGKVRFRNIVVTPAR